ncbi:MAG TPA: adenylate/guanylate cyclase domain-containing protein [Burkholderiales bacterium]|nr:adenylate/guanylate cyclase domain-containing protein [Burkholderiales bacterium]
MKRNLVRIAVGLVVVVILLLHVAKQLNIPIIDAFEAIIYDARLRLTMPRTVDTRIVILDIDQKSIAERERGGEGRWPWPRDRLALMLDSIFDHYQMAIVGFDVVFAEKDNSSGLRVLEDLAERDLKGVAPYQSALSEVKPRLDYDALFAKSMKDRAVVLGYAFDRADVSIGAIPPPVLKTSEFKFPPSAYPYEGFNGNLPAFQQNAASAGHFNPVVENDGITRRVPMIVKYKDGYYEALSLAMLRVLLGSPPIKSDIGEEGLSMGYEGLEGLIVGKYRVPVDAEAAALIPYRGPKGSFEYYSLVDVINKRVPVEALRGKIALIGTTVPGLLDLRATPVDPSYPGVEIHANMIAAMLDENLQQRPPYAPGAEFATILLLGLLLAVWLPGLSPTRAIAVALAALLLVAGGNLALYEFEHLVFPLASSLVLIIVLFTLNMAYGFLVEARGRKEITGRFGQYVPPEVVDQIAQDPENASMRGESREMTVLFTDVRGFTTISEGLEAQALSTLMNEFLTPLTEVIYKHRGTIDKYMGDCIMAFWGAPLKDPDHARNGVLAGLEMQRTLKALQPTFRDRNWPEIRIGVGLNTGRMSVGNMGSRVRLAYTVMGDAVNLASRLEGITKEYGADIIVGEDTKNAVPDVVFREIDRVRVKGKDTAVTIYEPLGVEGEVPQAVLDDAALFHEALELYRRQEWELAELRLLRLKTLSPESYLYDTFLKRVALYRVSPPPQGWDGAFTFLSK